MPIVFGAKHIEIEIRLPGAKNSTTTTKNTNVYSHSIGYNQPASNYYCSSSSLLLLYSYKNYP
jgi:hypothetical protein